MQSEAIFNNKRTYLALAHAGPWRPIPDDLITMATFFKLIVLIEVIFMQCILANDKYRLVSNIRRTLVGN